MSWRTPTPFAVGKQGRLVQPLRGRMFHPVRQAAAPRSSHSRPWLVDSRADSPWLGWLVGAATASSLGSLTCCCERQARPGGVLAAPSPDSCEGALTALALLFAVAPPSCWKYCCCIFATQQPVEGVGAGRVSEGHEAVSTGAGSAPGGGGAQRNAAGWTSGCAMPQCMDISQGCHRLPTVGCGGVSAC